MEHVLELSGLTIGYGQTAVAADMNLSLKEGEMVCLIGANGCGKSTLLKTISGLIPSLKGSIQLQGQDLAKLTAQDLSQKIAMVLTDKPDTANLRVQELVALGRSPYTNWLGSLSADDEALVSKAMIQTNTEHLADRMVKTLSDGQKQRVMIAKALAQDTPILFLDEPTAHLDLPNRVAILHLLHQLAQQTKKAILLSTHELDLAMQVADKLWLFGKDQQVHCDIPEALVLDQKLAEVFDTHLLKFSALTGQFELQKTSCVDITVTGNDTVKTYWTKKALERNGFRVIDTAEEKIAIHTDWSFKDHRFTSLPMLIEYLKHQHFKADPQA